MTPSRARLPCHRRPPARPPAPWTLTLVPLLLITSLARAQEFPTSIPLGLPAAIPAPADNPLAPPAFALGRRLFFDPILSVDRTVACASCHRPEHGFSSPEPNPPGASGRFALRHAPTLYNRAFGAHQRWDGRSTSLEQQVLLPIEDPNEMDLALAAATARLRASDAYRDAFASVWAGGVTEQNLSFALAAFVRGLVLGDSPVDRFQAGDEGALTAAQKAGLWLYESKGGCWQCHSGPNLSDEGFHNTGIGVIDGRPEEGRFAVTGDERDRGGFKTPTLRGVAATAPYMHDGSLASLEDVVAFYGRGGNPNPRLDRRLRKLELTAAERANLVAFLRALSPRE